MMLWDFYKNEIQLTQDGYRDYKYNDGLNLIDDIEKYIIYNNDYSSKQDLDKHINDMLRLCTVRDPQEKALCKASDIFDESSVTELLKREQKCFI